MRILFAFVIICLSLLVKAQNVPQYINYQTLIRNVDGTYIASKRVSLRLSIIKDSPTGLLIYQEVHDTETNDYGLVNLKIGDGISDDDFSAINWGDGPYYIQTEMSVEGGVFEEIGISPFSSVPYALYAQSSGTALQEGPGIAIVDNTIAARNDAALWNAGKIQNVDVSPTAPEVGDVLVFDGQKWMPGQAQNAKVPAGTSVISVNPESPAGYGFTGNTLTTTKTVGEWTQVSPMKNSRRYPAVSDCNGKIYVFGGEEDGNFTTNYVEVYDPLADSWSDLEPMTIERTLAYAASYKGKIYISGGFEDNSQTGSSRVEVYEPATNTWSRIADMNNGRWNHTLIAANDKLYAIGGLQSLRSEARVSSIEEYDFDANTWTIITIIPDHLASALGVYCNGEIYLVAGSENVGDSYTVSDKVIAYDLNLGEWNEKAPVLEARISYAIGVVNDKIIIAGGIKDGQHMGSSEIYSPATNTWLQIGDINPVRNCIRGVVLNNQMYLVGGQKREGNVNPKVNTIEKLNLAEKNEVMYIHTAQ